jgi:hypothetical protein
MNDELNEFREGFIKFVPITDVFRKSLAGTI